MGNVLEQLGLERPTFLAHHGNLKTLKNEGTANVNTEEMGGKAKESSEEIEARNEALVDEDENFPCEHCEKGFATFSIKATHIKYKEYAFKHRASSL